MSAPSFQSLKLAVALKAVALSAFPIAVIAAAILQRSVILLAGFAVAMVAISVFQKKSAARARGQVAPVSPAALVTGFALRLGGMIGLFIVLIGLLALFRETTLARSLGSIDALLLTLPTLASLGANALSQRIFGGAVQSSVDALRSAFDQPANTDPADGSVIIEGEIIDR